MAKNSKAGKKTAGKVQSAAKTKKKSGKKAKKKGKTAGQKAGATTKTKVKTKTTAKTKTKAKTHGKEKTAAKLKAKGKTKAKKPSTAKKPPAPRESTAVKTAKRPAKAPKAAASSLSLAPRLPPTPLPQIGDMAPDFTLATDGGTNISLQDYLGKQNIVLYFYPKDDTPGCTKQACTFEEHMPNFTAKDTLILGVSTDDEHSHAKFRSKYNLSFPLGADTDHAVAERYGVWGEKTNYGRTYMGVTRTTFLIDKTGRIAAVWPRVKVEGHSDEVQAAVANLPA